MDLNKIKEIAEKNLGMHKPDKFQVIYIKVAKGDYTEVADASSTENKNVNSAFGLLKDKIGGIMRFLN